MNIGVVAKLKIKEEYRVEVYSELVLLHKLTHEKDEGCIQYDLTQDLEDKSVFIFVEVWKDEEALSLHEKTEHFANFLQNVDGKLEFVEINKTIKKL